MKLQFKSDTNRQICINCHFLVKSIRDSALAQNDYVFTLSFQERKRICQTDFSWLDTSHSLRCFRGIWGEGYHISRKDELYQQTVETTRKHECYFFKYRTSLDLPSAIDLQDKQSTKRYALFEYRRWLLDFIVVALTLLFSVIVTLKQFGVVP